MKILSFDTTMQACSASFIDTEKEGEQQSVYESLERGHAEAIVPMIESVMNVSNCSYQELDCIAVTLGPGAFTGVRVGVATARGLGLSTGVDVYGFSSLHVIAARAREQLGDGYLSEFDRMLVAVDARRGEIYLQSFDINAQPLIEACAVVPEQFAEFSENGKILVVGSGGSLLSDIVSQGAQQVVFECPDLLPDAQNIGQLVLSDQGIHETLSPLYLRAPDAKPQVGKQIARAQN